MRIYVLCSGQDDNIGDVVLRRAMLDSLRVQGELHVHLGATSEGFRDGLGLSANDTVYTSKDQWRRSLWRAAFRKRVWLVSKPGELILERAQVLPLLRLVPVTVAVLLCRGKVLTLGIGQRASHSGYRAALKPMFRLSSLLAWRDVKSREEFGIGQLMPDWGFSESRYGTGRGARSRLVLAYRGDRQGLSLGTITELKRAAELLGIVPVVAVQVRRDRERAQQMSLALNCELVDWPDERSHEEQEGVLRQLYAESALVVSDRLHVLIVAMCEGAVPVCLSERTDHKVAQHFDAVGYRGVVAQAGEHSLNSVSDALRAAMRRSDESDRCLVMARRRISEVETAIHKLSKAQASGAHV